MRQLAPVLIVLAGAVLSALGAAWTAMRQIDSARQRADFEKELRLKSDEIASLNKQLLANVTGGESYCYLDMPGYATSSEVVTPMLFHEGEHPALDVSVHIANITERIARWKAPTNAPLAERLASDMFDSEMLFHGNVSPGKGMMFAPITLPADANEQRYEVRISARNGSVIQRFTFLRIDGQWAPAVQTVRVKADGSQSVTERIPPNFPRRSDGTFAW